MRRPKPAPIGATLLERLRTSREGRSLERYAQALGVSEEVLRRAFCGERLSPEARGFLALGLAELHRVAA